MANEIDRLMSLDPLYLSAGDIDAIVAYHRKARAAYASGIKPKRGKEEPIDLGKIGLATPVTVKRRKV